MKQEQIVALIGVVGIFVTGAVGGAVGYELGLEKRPEKYILIVPTDNRNITVDLKCTADGDHYVCIPDIKTMREEDQGDTE